MVSTIIILGENYLYLIRNKGELYNDYLLNFDELDVNILNYTAI